MSFAVIPAIDLRGGRVVRLRQGDFGAETVYGDDPAAVAGAFAVAGARWLHVVDLDGARDGSPRQLPVAGRIAAAARQGTEQAAGAARAAVELAGGLRTRGDVVAAFEAGAARVVVGTAALRDPGFAADLVEGFGADRVVAAIDVRGGDALGDGWQRGARGVRAEDAAVRLAQAGVRTFEVTAIERDGLLSGPDLALLGRLVALAAGDVIASAGIASLDDLRAVRDVGCRGAIVGRALYEGRLRLADALTLAG